MPVMHEQICEQCSKTFRTLANRKCDTCRKIERKCRICGTIFRDTHGTCFNCRYTPRTCRKCGIQFKSTSNIMCANCRRKNKICEECGKSYKGTANVCGSCHYYRIGLERWHVYLSARRSRQNPLPRGVYEEIRNSGPCVYCGKKSSTVDHIIPISRGGLEISENLVPACLPCNVSKHIRLLTEWDNTRVNHALVISSKVRAVMELIRNGEIVA
jgi:5-methylcytosine-specific restriction endonuclease McrA